MAIWEKSKCYSAGLMEGKQPQVHAGVSPGLFQIKWTGVVAFYWLHYPFDFKQHVVTQFCRQSACIHIDRACETCGNYLLKSRKNQNSWLPQFMKFYQNQDDKTMCLNISRDSWFTDYFWGSIESKIISQRLEHDFWTTKIASVIHSSEITVVHLNMHSCLLASFQLEKNLVKLGIFFI